MPTGAAELYLSNVESNSRFFGQAGGYLRETHSAQVVEMIRDRFRKEPSSGNMWNALYGLRQTNTPASRAVLEEIATSATNENTRNQARRHLESLDELAKELAAAGESER